MSRELEIGEAIKMYEGLISSLEKEIIDYKKEQALYREMIRYKKAELERYIEAQRGKGGA